MRKYNSQEEFEAEIKNGVFYSEDSIDITSFSLDVTADLEVRDLNAADIKARNVEARDVKAWDLEVRNLNAADVKAWDVKAWDVKVRDLEVRDLNAANVKARDIKLRDLNAGDVKARDISYYAVAFAYRNIQAKSIEGRRKNARHFVLDGKIEIMEGGK